VREIFRQVLSELTSAFRRLEAQVPAPAKVPFRDSFKVRYTEKTPQQALLQKFARQISGLHALDLLLLHGFLQEQGVIQRTLGDLHEDISFIAFALIRGDWTEHHTRYLEDFWSDDPVGAVRRDKIRAYVNRAGGLPDPSSANANGRDIFRAYSGYVHAASVNTLDMCAGETMTYLLAGMRDSPLYRDHLDDAWNYYYRGLVSSVFIAQAFGDEEIRSERYISLKSFERQFADRLFPESYAAT
jgi:hypothetical protein